MGVASIAVVNQLVRRLVPREGFHDLLPDPHYRWMIGHAQRGQATPLGRRITKTDSSRKLIVGTTRKSMAEIPAMWFRRNVFHVLPNTLV
jgi:hypothetical protein